MDQLSVLRVVVASPGDVKAEREIIPRVIEEINRNIARNLGLRLEVYRWETDSHPGFHPAGPQGLIDPQLKIEDCDILIGIFWRRFGTPVSDANSGTEHEFRLAYNAWGKKRKPQIMVYFSQRSYTPKSKEETDQWGLVLQFKKEFPREGLWWDYKNKSEFERLTRNHLSHFLSSPLLGSDSEPEKQLFVSYSHKDKKLLDNLEIYLRKERMVFKTWSDQDIQREQRWRDEVKYALTHSSAAVLLVTQNFLDSDFIAGKELLPPLAVAKEQGLPILWLAASASNVEDTVIANYSCLNDPLRPLVLLLEPQLDREFARIAEEIRTRGLRATQRRKQISRRQA